MSQFGMVGKMTTNANDREKLVEILTQASQMMEALDTCQFYIVSEDTDDAGTVWVMELWDSKEAHDASLTRDDVRALIGQAIPLLKGQPDGASLTPIAGNGITGKS